MTATARGWLAASVPIVLWIIHLSAAAAFVQATCTHQSLRWIPHVLTVVLALACIPFLVIAARLLGGSAGNETETPEDMIFLGRLALVLGGFSLLLIVVEGLFAVWIGPCR